MKESSEFRPNASLLCVYIGCGFSQLLLMTTVDQRQERCHWLTHESWLDQWEASIGKQCSWADQPLARPPHSHCQSSWPYGWILLLGDALPLLAQAGPAPANQPPLAMATNDSTALAIPGQVIPFFYTKTTMMKTVL